MTEENLSVLDRSGVLHANPGGGRSLTRRAKWGLWGLCAGLAAGFALMHLL